MSTITGSVDIARSPQDVFGFVADPLRRPEWQSSVRAVEVVRLVAGGVGTRIRERRRIQGVIRSLTFEVTEHEPGRRYCYRGVDGPVRVRVALTLTPLDGGGRTRLGIDIDVSGVGPARALAALARQVIRAEAPADGAALKRRLEG